MFKRILCLFMSCLFLSVPLLVTEAESDEGFDMNALTEDYVIVVNADNPSQSVCGLEKNADKKCYPASTTKILTCLIALEEGNMEDQITVPSIADSDRVAGTTMGIQKNEVYSLEDLIYGMMLPSGNDAAIAIAIGMYGSVKAFAERMNEKAAEIGMTNSHFENPNGLHNENHYTTARDMALLAAYALQNEAFRKVVATKEYTAVSSKGNRIKVRTTNRYMRNYTSNSYTPQSVLWDEAIGIKTGETPYAGKCFVAAAERNGTIYIAALYHGDMPSSSASLKKQDAYSVVRFKDARQLIEYAFEHDLTTITIQDLIERGVPVSIKKGYDAEHGLLSSSYQIVWDQTESWSAPACEFPPALLQDPIPEEMIRISWTADNAIPDREMGTAEVVLDNVPLFSAPVICSSVEQFTPVPTPEPTPIPTPTPEPPSEIVIVPHPIETEIPSPVSTESSSASAWNWFLSCAPEPVNP